MKITLFVPVLNEIDGLKAIMPKLPDLFCQILVVDGQSVDGSAEWAKSQGYDVYLQKNKGIRNAYIEAWPLIRGDYVLTFSPDGNCLPEDILPMVQKISEGNDMVIASRYLPPAYSEDDDTITGFGNWVFTFLINLIHRGNYTDAMTIFRIYKTKLFYDLDLHLEKSYFPEKIFFTVIGIEPLLSVRALKTNQRISEIPSVEPKRSHGTRKLQIFRWGGSYMSQVFLEKFFWRKA